MLTWPMMALGWVTNLFQRGVTSLQRIQNILNEQPVIVPPANPVPIPRELNSIFLNNLTFAYPNQSDPTLQNVTLEIPQGILGIVGKTGSGKTTLSHLLARLYPVENDTLFWNGLDINKLDLAEVRRRIALVPQDITVFSDTVRANIAMGRPGAAQEDIEAVARAAAIHTEIGSLPKGYDTRIGEKGVKLSGGQRQRIALARALLSDRAVLIIDDGLSAVDIETEHEIISLMKPFIRDRICIVISHRLAPLAQADQLVVMDKGKIVGQGDHKHLLQTNRFYATIYDYQTSRMGRG
jgi:ATP-binding cassette subfamily B protein